MELQAAILFPAVFNQSVKKCDNKAEVLSLTTLQLARRVLEGLPPGRTVVCCDKHGGRTYYAGVLQHIFPDELVLARVETAALAVYDVKHQGRSIEFRFQPKGERHLATALASMTAKYLRELSMRPFNAFWQRHIPNLKPTAGYPTDARRFFDDIGDVRQRLTIANELICALPITYPSLFNNLIISVFHCGTSFLQMPRLFVFFVVISARLACAALCGLPALPVVQRILPNVPSERTVTSDASQNRSD